MRTLLMLYLCDLSLVLQRGEFSDEATHKLCGVLLLITALCDRLVLELHAEIKKGGQTKNPEGTKTVHRKINNCFHTYLCIQTGL